MSDNSSSQSDDITLLSRMAMHAYSYTDCLPEVTPRRQAIDAAQSILSALEPVFVHRRFLKSYSKEVIGHDKAVKLSHQ